MEETFLRAWLAARQEAERLGVRFRPMERENAMAQAHRTLSGHRESDGFTQLLGKGRLDLTLEALAVKRQFTGLFTDQEANEALTRLLNVGYRF